MPEANVLFIDDAHPLLKEMLENSGFQTDIFPLISREEILKIIHKYTGIIIRSRIKLDKEILDRAICLRFIGRVGAGMESIDTDYADSKNIQCFNSPEGNRDAVGEHSLALLLSLFNRITIADRQIRQGIRLREENRGVEIKNKTIAIIGYGNMGSAFAQRLSGFNCNVIAYDKYKKGYSNNFVWETTMDDIFENADVVSFHVPLTEETHYLLNESYINNFKKNIWVINTSRGPVIKTEALVAALENGKVCGAGLDVIEYENISFEKLDTKDIPETYTRLLKSDKVILTPHVAGWTVESKIKLAQVLADKIVIWAKNEEII
jgi:D-3-phosphoglycerate dehydrogenase / 2-oxoglutarate reductase